VNPLPPPLGSGELVFWRLDEAIHAPNWDSGEGSYLAGGRWNPIGTRAVYASLDPATAILELAVHRTLRALDTTPHVLTQARLVDPTQVHVVESSRVPNPNWLKPGTPSAGQQDFGGGLLKAHAFVLLPSVVSSHSWNVIFDPVKTTGFYDRVGQERFALDPRLHSPGTA
jgi:RES domain-containing protein